MILTGPEIKKEVLRGSITIEPFNVTQLNPNSYNVRLSDMVLVYDEYILDAAVENKSHVMTVPTDGILLDSYHIYLGATSEIIGSNEYVPIVRARSSVARLGLFVHVTADLIDLGYFGQVTLQLHAVQPTRIYPDMEIGQVTFWKTQGEKVRYAGKYQGSIGPMPSKSYLDWPSP
jgi:dCTP deaminase